MLIVLNRPGRNTWCSAAEAVKLPLSHGKTGPLSCKKISTANRRKFIPKNCCPSGPDQCQSCRDSGQGRSKRADSSSHNPRVGQVLPSAVRWLLNPAVDRRYPMLPGLQHPGSHGGRAGQWQREKMHVKPRVQMRKHVTHHTHCWVEKHVCRAYTNLET